MNVIILQSAEDDLESIGDFIARDNPKRALSFVGELRLACQRLADAPMVISVSHATPTPESADGLSGVI